MEETCVLFINGPFCKTDREIYLLMIFINDVTSQFDELYWLIDEKMSFYYVQLYNMAYRNVTVFNQIIKKIFRSDCIGQNKQ